MDLVEFLNMTVENASMAVKNLRKALTDCQEESAALKSRSLSLEVQPCTKKRLTEKAPIFREENSRSPRYSKRKVKKDI
jgi:hypothetical protein